MILTKLNKLLHIRRHDVGTAALAPTTSIAAPVHELDGHDASSIGVPVRNILWLFVVTRLFLVLVTYFGYIILTAPKYSSKPVNVIAMLTSWNHWDAANYIRIAQYGYQTRYDFAFFPLFPLLISVIAHVLGSWSYLLVGTLISNGALLATLFLLNRLAMDIVGEQGEQGEQGKQGEQGALVAERTLLYLCIFPTAFFFFAAYNESLFLFFLVATFLALRRQRWWLAGLLGLLATLTRSAGILLVVPYVYEVWAARKHVLSMRGNLFSGVLPLFLIPAGMLIYSIYCWLVFGNPLAFASAQSHWGRHLSFPWQGVWQAFSALLLDHPQPFGSANQAHLLLDLSATLGFIVLAVIGWRKLPKSYSLWMGILLLYILLDPATDKPDILLSNQRFVLEMFPGFITLAMFGIRYPRLHQAVLLAFPTLLATLSIVFIMNRWIV